MIGDQNVKRNVRPLQLHGASTHERGELFEGIADFKAQAAHRVTVHAVYGAVAMRTREDFDRVRTLDGKRFHEIVRLKMKMIDRRVRSEGVVSYAEVRISRFSRHVQRRKQIFWADLLRKHVCHARTKQHVSVLDRRNINQNHGRALTHGCRRFKHRATDVFVRLTRELGERKEHLFEIRLREVELARVKVLTNFIHRKLCRTFIRRSTDVELRDVLLFAVYNLCADRGDVVPKQAAGESIFPRGDQNAIEFTRVGDVTRKTPRVVVIVFVVGHARSVPINVGNDEILKRPKRTHALEHLHGFVFQVSDLRELKLRRA